MTAPPRTRLLVGSDFHLGPLCHAFERRLGEDVLPIFCGDLVNRPRGDAPAYFALLERWERANGDLFVVPGNHDPEDAGRWEGVRVHERRGLVILAVPVIPILYKIPSWTHEYAETTIERMLAPHRGGRYDVVASHAPPHGLTDGLASGRHVGSRALLDFAQVSHVGLWVCGHVHQGRAARAAVAGRPLVNAARTLLDLEAPPRLGG